MKDELIKLTIDDKEVEVKKGTTILEAARQAVSSPLLETNISGATDAIINITGGANLTLFEAEDAAEVVRSTSNNDINTIFGAVINENLTDEVIVTVIATGFEKGEQKEKEVPNNNTNQVNKNISQQTQSRINNLIQDDDDDDDIPNFLKNRRSF